jgi:hypothetical protein
VLEEQASPTGQYLVRINTHKGRIERDTHEAAKIDDRFVNHLIYLQNLEAAVQFLLGIGSSQVMKQENTISTAQTITL